MNRWTRTAAAGIAIVATLASAQVSSIRSAPRDVKPAIINVSATPPIISIDGKADRFSPGARIRDRDNRLVLTGTLGADGASGGAGAGVGTGATGEAGACAAGSTAGGVTPPRLSRA